MAAVCKQLEAAQRFLRQVCKLPSFESLREKQLTVVLSVLKKTKVLSLKDANSILQMLESDIWSEDLSQQVREAVSGLLVVEAADQGEDSGKRGPKGQDFQNFLVFLKDSQWNALQQSSTVSAGCSMLASMLGQLGLRHPSEWTFGTMYCFMHLVQKREVPEASQAYNEIFKLKPAVRKQLEGLPEPVVYLQQLPKTPEELPERLFNEVFASERPGVPKVSKDSLLFTTSLISMRKSSDKVIDPQKVAPAPVDPLAAMATMSTALMAHLVTTSGAGSTQAVAAPTLAREAAPPPMLALCDAPHPTAEATGAVEAEKAETSLVPVVPPEPSQVDQYLGDLKSCLQREGSGKKAKMRRPSAAASSLNGKGGSSVLQEAPAGPQKAKAKAEGKQQPRKKPAVKTPGALKRPAASSGPRSIKEVPGLSWQQRVRMRPEGCSKCRWHRGCTLSCFATYLKQQSEC
ncbi:PIP5K4 [Symbiodinium sp. CCMP2456]|nr:PIP5K4 [Symbiodinium sp. CCMP2456]